MPLFFFHLRTGQGLEADDVGTPFPDLDAAYLDVCRAIPDMVKGLLRDGADPMRCAFEIVDEGGRLLMDVPFSERLTKAAVRPRPTAPALPLICAEMLDDLFSRATSAVAEARELHRSIRQSRLDLARRAASGTSFLDAIARAYGLSDAGASEGP